MMQHSAQCSALVLNFEGLKLKAYPDPASKGDPWTIGVGHTGKEVKKGLVWTRLYALTVLEADLIQRDLMVNKLSFNESMPQFQFDALVSFVFNVGYTNLADSTLLRMHRARDYKGAEAQFGRWIRASGKVMPGLIKRRAAEARMYGGHDA